MSHKHRSVDTYLISEEMCLFSCCLVLASQRSKSAAEHLPQSCRGLLHTDTSALQTLGLEPFSSLFTTWPLCADVTAATSSGALLLGYLYGRRGAPSGKPFSKQYITTLCQPCQQFIRSTGTLPNSYQLSHIYDVCTYHMDDE